MKYRSTKRAKALAIPGSVKDAVWERDEHRCVYCGSPYALPEAHYIPRSRGGLGIEQNILTLCRKHHDLYDHGRRELKEEMREYFKRYLEARYNDWSEDVLIYRREI